MQLIFEQLRVGGDRNFGYLLADRDAKTGILIDPSYAPDMAVQRALDQDIKITHILNTHGHEDHINGNSKAVELTGAIVAAHPDSPALPEKKLADDEELQVGALRLKILYTPGHCEDHLVIYESTYRILITGDLLFVGKVGGTKDEHDARLEWNSLQHVLETIPDVATVWPGHDYGVRPSSTIGLEKKSNPFLLCQDLAAFIQLKNDWPIHKKRYGLK